MPESEIRDSLNYYRQYFEEQKAMGYSESEIVTSLGSPRLIARSIIDAREAVSGQDRQADYGGQDSYYNGGQSGGTAEAREDIMAAAGKVRAVIMTPKRGVITVMRMNRRSSDKEGGWSQACFRDYPYSDHSRIADSGIAAGGGRTDSGADCSRLIRGSR